MGLGLLEIEASIAMGVPPKMDGSQRENPIKMWKTHERPIKMEVYGWLYKGNAQSKTIDLGVPLF